jgi:hypothetical protein
VEALRLRLCAHLYLHAFHVATGPLAGTIVRPGA